MYAVGHVALSREGTFLAAVLEAGEGAALGHLAAAELWEVRKYRAPLIDVVVPKRRRVKTATRIHRTTLHPRDVTVHKGIPVTTIARMLVDLTDVLNAYDLANVIHEAAFKRRFSELADPRRDGPSERTPQPQDASSKRSNSTPPEAPGSRAATRPPFSRCSRTCPNRSSTRSVHGIEVDFHWPAYKLVVEVDGPGHADRGPSATTRCKEAAFSKPRATR